MSSMLHTFQDGGAAMFALLPVALLGGLIALVRVALSGRTSFLGLGAATTLLLLSVGLGGTLYGLGQAFQAVGYADPEMRGELMRYGMGAAILPTKFAGVLLVPIGALHLLALARQRAPVPTPLKLAAVAVMGLASLSVLGSATTLALVWSSFEELLIPQGAGAPEAAMRQASRLATLMSVGTLTAALGGLLAAFTGLLSLVCGGVSWSRGRAAPEAP